MEKVEASRGWMVRAASAGRGLFARVDAAPLRRAASRLADPFVAEATDGARPGERLAGALRINPSGTVLEGRRVVARAKIATDWLVEAFPSPLVLDRAAMPVGYDPAADVVTLLTEVLPAALWLDAHDPDAVLLAGLPLARLNATQEALNARLFAGRRMRPHAAHRVARVPAVWWPPADVALAADLPAAGERVAATFDAPRERGGVVALLPAGHPAARGLRAAWGPDAVFDPARDPLWRWAPRLCAAKGIATAPGRLSRLATLNDGAAHLAITDDDAATRWRAALGL